MPQPELFEIKTVRMVPVTAVLRKFEFLSIQEWYDELADGPWGYGDTDHVLVNADGALAWVREHLDRHSEGLSTIEVEQFGLRIQRVRESLDDCFVDLAT